MTHSLFETKNIVRAYLSSKDESNTAFAIRANLTEHTVRQAVKNPGWNPRLKTLQAMYEAVPAAFIREKFGSTNECPSSLQESTNVEQLL